MPRIRYIGEKSIKQDNVALTGICWNGHGDVQEVPASAVAKLLQHSSVWELVEGDPAEPDIDADAPADLEALRAQARTLGIEVVPQWRIARLQREINAALAKSQTASTPA